MNDPRTTSSWGQKFSNAFRGIAVGVSEQNSFLVHIPVAIAVVVMALLLQIELIRFSILLLCIGTVMAAELFNSSLEALAGAVTQEVDPQIRDALDIASGAVLVLTIAASTIGLAIFLPEIATLFAAR